MVVGFLGLVEREQLHHALDAVRLGKRKTVLAIGGDARRPASDRQTRRDEGDWTCGYLSVTLSDT